MSLNAKFLALPSCIRAQTQRWKVLKQKGRVHLGLNVSHLGDVGLNG